MRLAAVDLLRGLLMILVALDHTRDYFLECYHRSDRSYGFLAGAVCHAMGYAPVRSWVCGIDWSVRLSAA